LARDRHALSKFLSYVLRHHPEAIGIALDRDGSVDVDTLLDALNRHGRPTDRAQLDRLVATSDKQRFAFSPDHTRIRANQGHSVEVELGLLPTQPPKVLFHGTVERLLPSIRARGLVKGQRHHVHLSASPDVAMVVGSRRGQALVLDIDAERMARAGYQFYRTDNAVWLTESVPPDFIRFPSS
jgi:putative RNA 2'-phosphotransferase